jgi:lipopolysaccharide export system protein LptC
MRTRLSRPSLTVERPVAGQREIRLPARARAGGPTVPVSASRPLLFSGGVLVVLLALCLGGWGLWRLASAERAVATPPPPPLASSKGPELEMQGIHMVESKDGTKLWEVRADKAEVFERDGVSVLRQMDTPVEVILYSSQGTLTALAAEAAIQLKTKDLTLRGDVRGRSDRGTSLRTATLHWTAATRLLHTTDDVVLTRGGMVSTGKGMEAETNLERVRILSGIASQVVPGLEDPARGATGAGAPRATPGRPGGKG